MNNSKLKIKNLALDSKIFVAGGTGLVGSAIIKNLLEKMLSSQQLKQFFLKKIL